MSPTYPSFDLDPFSDDLLDEPYDYYCALRDAGPVFRLDRYDVLGLARFDDVRAGLKDWHAFSSTDGPGFNDHMNAKLKDTVLASEPPDHEAVRGVMVRRLRLGRLRGFTPIADQMADEMVIGFLERNTFDAVTDLAKPFVTRFVGSVLGVPEEILDVAVNASLAGFNATGPMNQRAIESAPVIEELFEIMARLTKSDMKPGSMAWEILDAYEHGEIPETTPLQLIFNFLGPAFDTTINAIGSILWLFAQHPDQWRMVRAEPALVAAAVSEGLRVESPLQIWSRVARHSVVVDSVDIPAGMRVAVFIGAANRDERHYANPAQFDVQRNPVDHLSFGQGIHMCVGAPLARLEITSIVNALRGKAREIEVAGTPVRRLNNTTRGFASLPVAVR
jgi:cytochrome P450